MHDVRRCRVEKKNPERDRKRERKLETNRKHELTGKRSEIARVRAPCLKKKSLEQETAREGKEIQNCSCA